jgi:hypothetical protein
MLFKKSIHWMIMIALAVLLLATPQSALAWGGCASSYTVRWGDTLWSIANNYGTTVAAMRQANPNMGYWIYAGQTLCMPGAYQGNSYGYQSGGYMNNGYGNNYGNGSMGGAYGNNYSNGSMNNSYGNNYGNGYMGNGYGNGYMSNGYSNGYMGNGSSYGAPIYGGGTYGYRFRRCY